MAQSILKSVSGLGRLMGLDVLNNLVIRGSKLYYGDDDVGSGAGSIDLTTLSGGGSLLNKSVSDVAPGALVNDYAPSGYIGGTTNRLLLTAAVGGTVVNGLSAAGVPDGLTILISNISSTDPLSFPHLAIGSLAANQFSNQNAETVQIPPLGAARVTYVSSKWVFA